MPKRIVGAILGLLCLWSTCAAAWEGMGFSLDLPEGWTTELEDDSAYSWSSPDETADLMVVVAENEGAVNPFDIADEDLPTLMEPLSATYGENMEASLLAQGISCEISTISSQYSKLQWKDGQPVFQLESVYTLQIPEGEVLTLYARTYLFFTKAHSFAVTCQSANQAAMEEADRLGARSFTITEEIYDGQTDVGAAWGDVIFSAGMAMLFLALALWGAKELRKKRQARSQK